MKLIFTFLIFLCTLSINAQKYNRTTANQQDSVIIKPKPSTMSGIMQYNDCPVTDPVPYKGTRSGRTNGLNIPRNVTLNELKNIVLYELPHYRKIKHPRQ